MRWSPIGSRVRKNSTAVGCHESPEYLEAAAHRKKDGAGELEIVIVESI
jgi:Ni2+-binding GTPase involved in maturation of urease and hydrogenase